MLLPGANYPVMAHELRGVWFRLQQIDSQAHEIERLKRELKRRDEELKIAEKNAHFYREQLRLESRMGLMLAHLCEQSSGHD